MSPPTRRSGSRATPRQYKKDGGVGSTPSVSDIVLLGKGKIMPLYKYMSEKVAPLFARTLKVRFTQPSDLNDPFEFRPMLDLKGTSEELRNVVDEKLTELFSTLDSALDIMEKVQATDPRSSGTVPIQIIRKMIADNPSLEQGVMAVLQQAKKEFLQTARMEILWQAQWDQVQHTLGQALGIFSLTEDPAHTLMWSHYASKHFGVVVEFDNHHPWFDQRISSTDELRQLVQVSYVKNPHPRTWKQLNGADVLYTKGAEWDYEHEWRIIRPIVDGTEVSPGMVCFDVPPDAIRSIIFGCRTTAALEQEVRHHIGSKARLRHIRFKRVKLAGGGKIDVVDA